MNDNNMIQLELFSTLNDDTWRLRWREVKENPRGGRGGGGTQSRKGSGGCCDPRWLKKERRGGGGCLFMYSMIGELS